MTADAIKEFLTAKPFVPFLVHMPDRPSVRVPHHDFAHLSPNGRTMMIYNDDGDGGKVLDVALITQLEPKPLGPPKRRR